MTRLLYVGDPHVVPDELDDCQALLDLVTKTAVENVVDAVVFLGDQHHTHSLVRLEVVSFWRRNLCAMRKAEVKAVVKLKGNHDCFLEPDAKGSALDAYRDFQPWLTIVDEGVHYGVVDGVVFMPFCHTEERFRQCLEFAPTGFHRTLVCHQTFNGAKYENGFPAPDGFDLEKVFFPTVISGHIHTPQMVGKCWYVGAPRWRTFHDANIDRNIWLVEHDENGAIIRSEGISTGDVCRQIKHLELTPDVLAPKYINPAHVWHIDLRGPAEWVDENKRVWAGMPGIRLRTYKTNAAAPKVRESEGIDTAFVKFAAAYKPRFGTSVEQLGKMAQERLGL